MTEQNEEPTEQEIYIMMLNYIEEKEKHKKYFYNNIYNEKFILRTTERDNKKYI